LKPIFKYGFTYINIINLEEKEIRMKKNTKIALALVFVFIALIGVFTFLFLLPSPIAYRNDCGKSLEGFDSLFVYKQECPYCHAQFTAMESLNLTNHTYMIDAEDATCSKIINDYSDYIIYHKNSNNILAQVGILTPTTICLSTNKTFIGEMTSELLAEFYGNCTGGVI